MKGATFFDKVWADHVISPVDSGTDLLHIDRHLLHELTAFKGFDDLRAAGHRAHSPHLNLAVQDHILATEQGRTESSYAPGAAFVRAHRRNACDFGIRLIDIADASQGIVHVIGPELGFTLPGCTLVCGDSHTCTNGGLGALAFGIGASDIAHVLATQTLAVHRPRQMRIRVSGRLPTGTCAKDLILALMPRVGNANGFAVEYAGSAISALSVEERLTVCNMSVEFGARIGMIAPDEVVYDYLKGRPLAPRDPGWDHALAYWRTLESHPDARFDREIVFDCSGLSPQVTWGTSPEHTVAVDGVVPDPAAESNAERRASMEGALRYMDLRPGTPVAGLPVSHVFIGSCTNGRISDLRVAAKVVLGRRVAKGVRAMVVPGSSAVKRQAEKEGLAGVFRAAGFEWHESACSMCASVNGDFVPPGQRCVSTSNRNYEGRQGRGARTHLASVATAAESAVMGRIADARHREHR